jgi:hypothetical protein
MTQSEVDVQFRLGAPASVSAVEIRLRSSGDRWTATAAGAGRTEIALGRTARDALGAALDALGRQAAKVLAGDLALLAPSVEIARQEATLRRGA